MRLYVFVMTLCHSRMLYAEFVMRQNMEHFLQCHRNAFEFFGAVPQKVMVDNCRTAVETPSMHGDPVVNRRYADVANARVHGTTRKRPDEMFKEEKAAMGPLPLIPYDCSVAHQCRVGRQYRVVFETNRYSVPPELVGRTVAVNAYPQRIVIMHEGGTAAEHRRCYGRHMEVADPEHDRALIEKRRLAGNGHLLARFLASGETAGKYYRGLREKRFNPDLHARKIMALADRYGAEDVNRAMEDAMQFDAYSSECVLNILESRSRPLPEPGPLHLTRKSDCLDIDIGQADLGIYDIK
jgi:hypothetical protein